MEPIFLSADEHLSLFVLVLLQLVHIDTVVALVIVVQLVIVVAVVVVEYYTLTIVVKFDIAVRNS